jgi:hypothetical protein
MVNEYDPDVEPEASAWLDTPEGVRLDLVAAYHQRRRVRLPSPRLHAAIHAVVENQLALGELDVVNAVKRLQNEGLGRHDAIHAVGMVLTEHLSDVLQTGSEPSPSVHKRYFERLNSLTADEWRQSRH